jgi:hypothetical protein
LQRLQVPIAEYAANGSKTPEAQTVAG